MMRWSKDRACLECHKNIGHHVGPEMKPAALFEGQRCATCHREHKGTKATHRDDDRLCVSCHQDLKAHASAASALKVADFARDHPAFRVTIEGDDGRRADGSECRGERRGEAAAMNVGGAG